MKRRNCFDYKLTDFLLYLLLVQSFLLLFHQFFSQHLAVFLLGIFLLMVVVLFFQQFLLSVQAPILVLILIFLLVCLQFVFFVLFRRLLNYLSSLWILLLLVSSHKLPDFILVLL